MSPTTYLREAYISRVKYTSGETHRRPFIAVPFMTGPYWTPKTDLFKTEPQEV